MDAKIQLFAEKLKVFAYFAGLNSKNTMITKSVGWVNLTGR